MYRGSSAASLLICFNIPNPPQIPRHNNRLPSDILRLNVTHYWPKVLFLFPDKEDDTDNGRRSDYCKHRLKGSDVRSLNSCISLDNSSCCRDHVMCQIEDCHRDIESIGHKYNSNECFKDPLEAQ